MRTSRVHRQREALRDGVSLRYLCSLCGLNFSVPSATSVNSSSPATSDVQL
jgi:transposase-like protein